MLLIACKSEDEILTDKAKIQEIPNVKNELIFTAKKQTYKTSDKEIGATLLNEGTTEVGTGVHLFLQKKIEGVWYEFPYKVELTEEGLMIEHNQSAEYTLDESLLKYKLSSGEYRFTILSDGPAATFEITD